MDEASYYSDPLLLTDELVCRALVLPTAPCSHVSCKIDGKCSLQREITVIHEGSAMASVAGLLSLHSQGFHIERPRGGPVRKGSPP